MLSFLGSRSRYGRQIPTAHPGGQQAIQQGLPALAGRQPPPPRAALLGRQRAPHPPRRGCAIGRRRREQAASVAPAGQCRLAGQPRGRQPGSCKGDENQVNGTYTRKQVCLMRCTCATGRRTGGWPPPLRTLVCRFAGSQRWHPCSCKLFAWNSNPCRRSL